MAQMTWLVPGPWAARGAFVDAVARAGVRATGDALHLADDPRVIELVLVPEAHEPRRAFERPVTPLPRSLARAIEVARSFVALVMPLSIERDHALLASLARALERAGGLAVRIEDSGHVHPFGPWIEALEGGALFTLHDLAVRNFADHGSLYTCGMHLFDRPDAEHPRDGDEAEIAAALRALGLYQILESPSLASGHTFTPYAGAPRRELVRWPDARHDPRGPLHNPFGLWRLSPHGAGSRGATELALTPIPPLVALLEAEERRLGRPLAEREVLAVRDRAVCIAMPHAAVRTLEIERGYADVDPELVWAQWQIVRSRPS
jgi:hypothetical protein